MAILSVFPPKGQIILKANHSVVNSSQKMNKKTHTILSISKREDAQGSDFGVRFLEKLWTL
jgi:hypothetical protein